MIIDLFISLITSIKDTIERLVGLRSSDGGTKLIRPTNLAFGSTKDSGVGVSGKKLLIALCNVDYILQFSLNTLCERLANNGVKHSDQLLQVFDVE
jgi:hypothetical protein